MTESNSSGGGDGSTPTSFGGGSGTSIGPRSIHGSWPSAFNNPSVEPYLALENGYYVIHFWSVGFDTTYRITWQDSYGFWPTFASELVDPGWPRDTPIAMVCPYPYQGAAVCVRAIEYYDAGVWLSGSGHSYF